MVKMVCQIIYLPLRTWRTLRAWREEYPNPVADIAPPSNGLAIHFQRTSKLPTLRLTLMKGMNPASRVALLHDPIGLDKTDRNLGLHLSIQHVHQELYPASTVRRSLNQRFQSFKRASGNTHSLASPEVR